MWSRCLINQQLNGLARTACFGLGLVGSASIGYVSYHALTNYLERPTQASYVKPERISSYLVARSTFDDQIIDRLLSQNEELNYDRPLATHPYLRTQLIDLDFERWRHFMCKMKSEYRANSGPYYFKMSLAASGAIVGMIGTGVTGCLTYHVSRSLYDEFRAETRCCHLIRSGIKTTLIFSMLGLAGASFVVFARDTARDVLDIYDGIHRQ